MRHPYSESEDTGAPGAGEGEPFLRRWSRRKRGLDEESPDEMGGTDAPAGDPEPEPAPALTDAEMPDLSTIGDESDVSPFFSSGVSDDLRQAALKRLFRGPKFNIRDGLDDYDEDYRNFEALGDIVTTEMQRQQERLEARLRESGAGTEVAETTAEAMEEPAEVPQEMAGPSRGESDALAARGPGGPSGADTTSSGTGKSPAGTGTTDEYTTDGDGDERG